MSNIIGLANLDSGTIGVGIGDPDADVEWLGAWELTSTGRWNWYPEE